MKITNKLLIAGLLLPMNVLAHPGHPPGAEISQAGVSDLLVILSLVAMATFYLAVKQFKNRKQKVTIKTKRSID